MADEELPEKEKAAHSEVKYERTSEHAGKDCGNCEHVIEASSGTRCQTVKEPIYLTGYCERWEKK
jgi:hypothetical protein